MRSFLQAAALASAVLCGSAYAADGELDPTFGTDAEFPGYGFYLNPNGAPDNTLDTVGAIVKRPDGKIWVIGRMKAPGAYRLSLYLVRENGYPETGFGDLGLRTVVAPCTDFTVGDATLDAQGRLVVAIDRCSDFMVYRFLPNGDLDTDLAGSGVLTVPFNQGGDNQDVSQRVATTPEGNIIVAGSVTTASVNQLGIAHFTATGQPVPGFGNGGKVQMPFEWQVSEIFGVHGLGRMADGRIVVAGTLSETSQAVSDKKQFVVRLLANGNVDPSYGNVSPGISKINLKSPLGVTQSPRTFGAMVEPNGSVIHVGSILSSQVSSSTDMFVLRWRPDGQLDTTIGAHGVRQYALDFAGPNPSNPDHNGEGADRIVRQANGQYVIVGGSVIGDYYATAVLRVNRDFSVDTRFGNGGKIQHLVQVSTNGQHGQGASAVMLQPGRITVGGSAFTGFNGRVQMMFGMQHDEVFADPFD
ncbi:hypothetical protein [Tahibacter amnicola]|uniref:Delta-60 repeat protein n=1 Tax=Tahibacter amnicola TaxID=2976241 RepID=A0ABY6BBC5_9GAMM|nr:hypothetical protein [Tahibacter amnicola]UXI66999.1 hypothetical protein N4264_19930 [Tahibacter amnicola]